MNQDDQFLPVTVEPAPTGRPTKYKPEYAEQAYRMALLGLTDEEMAEVFDVSRSTFNQWKKQMPDFSDTVKRGKILADANVSASLYKRATGYEYPSEKIVTLSIGDGISKVERVPITAVVLPDPGAALNWLKNRQPNKWRDKQDVALSGEIHLTMNLEGDTAPQEKQ